MLDTIAIRLTFSIVLLVFGAYLLLCAVRRKGLIYSNAPLHNSPKYEVYVRFVRTVCFVFPVLFLANFVANVLSFSAENRLQEMYLAGDADGYAAYYGSAKGLYNAATITLVAVIAGVVVMLFIAALMTGMWAGDSEKEKLSGSHPAFRKRK